MANQIVVLGVNRAGIRRFVGTDRARTLERAVAMMPEDKQREVRRALAGFVEGQRDTIVVVDEYSIIDAHLAEVVP